MSDTAITSRRAALGLAAAVLIAAIAAPLHARPSDREIREKIADYERALKLKRARLDEMQTQRKQVESNGQAAKAEHDAQTAEIARLTQELEQFRGEATEHNKRSVELEREVRAGIDALPDVAAAADHFRRVDTARLRIHESILARVRTGDAYVSATAELERLRARHGVFNATPEADPNELAALSNQITSRQITLLQLEAEALSQSETYEQARRAAEEASRSLNETRAAHASVYDADPRLSTARASLERARQDINDRSKRLAEAKRAQSDAATAMRNASSLYASLGQQIGTLNRDIASLESGIRQLRRQL